jgi:hypothetical protein
LVSHPEEDDRVLRRIFGPKAEDEEEDREGYVISVRHCAFHQIVRRTNQRGPDAHD